MSDLLDRWIDSLINLGPGFWVPAGIVVLVWALYRLPRWRARRANRRRHREFERIARVRWEGNRKVDAWTERIGYGRKRSWFSRLRRRR